MDDWNTKDVHVFACRGTRVVYKQPKSWRLAYVFNLFEKFTTLIIPIRVCGTNSQNTHYFANF
jgi:hypothetical protein